MAHKPYPEDSRQFAEAMAERRRELRAYAAMSRINAMRVLETSEANQRERERQRYRRHMKVEVLLRRRRVIRKARELIKRIEREYG